MIYLRKPLRVALPVVIYLFTSVYIFSQSALTVELQSEYQVIDGFGGYGGAGAFFYGPPSGYPDWYSDEFIDFMVDDMGQTVIRINMVGSFNYREGVYDPDKHLPNFQNGGANAVYNATYSNLKGDGSYLNSSTKFVAAMDQKLRQNGDSLKLMLSLWSPPAWMKDNNDFMRGRLLPEYYGEFADFIVEYIKTYEANSGVKVYCLSLQNEPNLGHPQWTLGCVYTGEEYKAMVDSVHHRMIEAGVDHVRLIAPETVAFLDRMKTIMNPFLTDSVAASMIDMYCTHSYGGDGITLGSGSAYEWNRMQDYLQQLQPGNLWMSETGFNTNGWDGAMTDARRIFGALKFGKISSWIWWTNGHFRGMEKGDIGNDQLSYYASKHFFRYIRPGAVQVEAASDNSDIGVIAFTHKVRGEFTMVMLNNGSVNEDVSFSENLPETWKLYRSSSTEKCVDYGEVSGRSFTLPAKSITTLVYSSGLVPPSMDGPADMLMLSTSGEQVMDLTGISHGSGTGNEIVVTASSSDPSLTGDIQVEYISPSNSGTLRFSPVEGASGTAEITVTVTDTPGEFYGKVSKSFEVKVLSEINHPPVVTQIADTSLVKGTDFHVLMLSGLDDGNEAKQEVFVSATSSDRDIVRVVEASGTALTIYAKNTGEAVVTVQLEDDGGTELGGVDKMEMSVTVTVIEKQTGIQDPHSMAQIRIFPNPSDGIFHLSGHRDDMKYQLISPAGIALDLVDVKQDGMIDISGYSEGIYYLQIIDPTGGMVSTRLLVKTTGQ